MSRESRFDPHAFYNLLSTNLLHQTIAFRCGCKSTSDIKRSGRSNVNASTETTEILLDMILIVPKLKVHNIVKAISISYGSDVSILNDYVWTNFWQVVCRLCSQLATHTIVWPVRKGVWRFSSAIRISLQLFPFSWTKHVLTPTNQKLSSSRSSVFFQANRHLGKRGITHIDFFQTD